MRPEGVAGCGIRGCKCTHEPPACDHGWVSVFDADGHESVKRCSTCQMFADQLADEANQTRGPHGRPPIYN